MKIRSKIISYVLLSCFLVITAFSSYIYAEMKEVIIKTLDSRIREINRNIFLQIADEARRVPDVLKSDKYAKAYIQVSIGTERYYSVLAEQYEQVQSDKRKFNSVLITREAGSKDDFRFIRSETVLKGQKVDVLTGVSLYSIQDEMNEMLVSLVISSLAAFAAIGVLGIFISNTILRPIREISHASNNINSNNLNSRIPLPASKDEIYDLTLTLNSLFDRLDSSFTMQKEFIANISHEIKTPLTIINMAVDEALQSADENSAASKPLLKIYNNLNRVNRLVKDLINLSYIETNNLHEQESIDLNSVTDEILDNLSEMIEEKKLKVIKRVSGSVSVSGDAALMYSALLNLIHNAVKYASAGGEILIDIGEEDGRAEYVIENSCADNTGVEVDRIFDRFYRAEKSRSREYGGAGLGLAIVKEIIQKHDGSISVEKPEKQRIVFRFII